MNAFRNPGSRNLIPDVPVHMDRIRVIRNCSHGIPYDMHRNVIRTKLQRNRQCRASARIGHSICIERSILAFQFCTQPDLADIRIHIQTVLMDRRAEFRSEFSCIYSKVCKLCQCYVLKFHTHTLTGFHRNTVNTVLAFDRCQFLGNHPFILFIHLTIGSAHRFLIGNKVDRSVSVRCTVAYEINCFILFHCHRNGSIVAFITGIDPLDCLHILVGCQRRILVNVESCHAVYRCYSYQTGNPVNRRIDASHILTGLSPDSRLTKFPVIIIIICHRLIVCMT